MLGDDKEIQVDGERVVALQTTSGKVKLIHNVQYVLGLAHNQLSVGWLLINGYSILFENEPCSIKEMKIRQQVSRILMTKNRMFPLKVSKAKNLNMVFKALKTLII